MTFLHDHVGPAITIILIVTLLWSMHDLRQSHRDEDEE